MSTPDFEKGREFGSRETELAIVRWVEAQAIVARSSGRPYIASWITRIAQAIQNGEHREDGPS
jgi:hypothetical protein